MLLAMRVESIGERLRGLGEVVDRYERGDPEFPEAAIAWLRAGEQLLLRLHVREGADLAALRASIARAGERAPERDAEATSRRGAARRARAAAAAEALERAAALLQQAAGEADTRLRHFDTKLTEAMTAAVLVGLVEPQRGDPRERWLARTWQRLADHQATRPTAVYLAAALHAPDRLYLLDRVLARLVEPNLGVLVP